MSTWEYDLKDKPQTNRNDLKRDKLITDQFKHKSKMVAGKSNSLTS